MEAVTPSDDPVDLMVPEAAVEELVAEPTVTPVVEEEAPAPAEAKPEKGSFVVLVELPANGQGHAIASTKGKAQYWMLPVDEKLHKRMEERRKQFFHATLRSDGSGIKLGKYAPYQEGW